MPKESSTRAVDRAPGDPVAWAVQHRPIIDWNQYLTLQDLPDLLDVTPYTVKVWRINTRKVVAATPPGQPVQLPNNALPIPDAPREILDFEGRPVWRRTTILRWARQTDRLTEDMRPKPAPGGEVRAAA